MQLSIIIPVCNTWLNLIKILKYLKSKKELFNFEVIIIDDKSSVVPKKIVEKIKSIKNFKIVFLSRNYGPGYARNIGIKKAKGKYIAFLDADDLWKKNKIKLQLNYMIKNNLEISHTDYEILSVNKKKKKVIKAKSFKDYKKLLFSCDIGLSTVMMNRELISRTCKFPKLKTKEDFVLWLLILKRNIKIGSLNKNLTKWRKLENSLSSSIFQRLKDGFTLYNDYMKFSILKSFLYLFILSVNSYKKK